MHRSSAAQPVPVWRSRRSYGKSSKSSNLLRTRPFIVILIPTRRLFQCVSANTSGSSCTSCRTLVQTTTCSLWQRSCMTLLKPFEGRSCTSAPRPRRARPRVFSLPSSRASSSLTTSTLPSTITTTGNSSSRHTSQWMIPLVLRNREQPSPTSVCESSSRNPTNRDHTKLKSKWMAKEENCQQRKFQLTSSKLCLVTTSVSKVVSCFT